MIRMIVSAIMAGSLLGQSPVGMVELSVVPVSMKGFSKLSRLDKLEVGLWNVYARNNDQNAPANVTVEDIAIACQQVRPLTSTEAAMLLTVKQSESRGKLITDIAEDGALIGMAFVSPWFLAAKPVYDKFHQQVQDRTPDETQLIGLLSQDSVTLMPGAKGHFSFVASLVHGAATCHTTIFPAKPGNSASAVFIQPQPALAGPTSATMFSDLADGKTVTMGPLTGTIGTKDAIIPQQCAPGSHWITTPPGGCEPNVRPMQAPVMQSFVADAPAPALASGPPSVTTLCPKAGDGVCIVVLANQDGTLSGDPSSLPVGTKYAVLCPPAGTPGTCVVVIGSMTTTNGPALVITRDEARSRTKNALGWLSTSELCGN